MFKNVFIVGVDAFVSRMFVSYGFAVVDSLDNANLVCFTGGEDINPSLYGCKKHPQTFFNHYRDDAEVKVVRECSAKDIPMVGICRGGQLLNVLNGGEMYQHVHGHTRDHYAMIDGEGIFVTSTHHQMMKPAKEGVVIGVAHISPRREYVSAAGEYTIDKASEESPDIEVVHYPLTQCLCFQPHPEYNIDSECTKVFFKLINNYFFDEGNV